MSKEEIEIIKKMLNNVSDNLKIENTEVNKLVLTKNESIILNNYIQQLETKEQKVREKLEELKKEYKEALENNSTKAFILKCQIEILEEIMKGEE